MLSIEQVTYFVPNTFINIEESYQKFNLSKIEARTFSKIYGIKQVPIIENLSLVDLVSMPIKKLLREPFLDRNSIAVLIHAHTAKVINVFGASVIHQVKERLHLSQALSFSMTLNNCASTIDALELAYFFLKNKGKQWKAIIVSGEKAFTPSVQVIPNTSITGDASAACLVSLTGQSHRLLACHVETHGAYAKGIWLDPETAKSFETHYVQLLIKAVESALKKARITKAQLKFIIPHNVNMISWLRFARVFDFAREKIYLDNVQKYAHCFGSDIFINYADMLSKNLLQVGDYYLMATVGLGATFAVAVFQY